MASGNQHNAIGWVFLGVGLSIGVDSVAHGFVQHQVQSRADPGALAGAAAVYNANAFLAFAFVPATFLLLLFPDGRLLSARWRPIAWCAGTGFLGALVTNAMVDTPNDDFATVQSPFAVSSPIIDPLAYASLLLMYVGVFGAVASVVVRFRRGSHVQRQQIEWLAAAGALLAVVLPIDAALEGVLGGAAFASALALLGLPAAVGVAILRHNLYDVDLVINRALVYGALTATLAAAYLGAVLVLQLALSPLTGSSGPAVAASTLAVAALFRPARARIQGAVDRRFYRGRYDAARTLEQFGARLRDEVDLDALAADLRAVVQETMQPAHVSLWLRPGSDAHGRAEARRPTSAAG